MTVKVVHTEGEDWAHVAKICAERLLDDGAEFGHSALGFLYVTDALAEDLSSVLTYLRQKTGIVHWVGSVGIGILANSGKAGDAENSGEYFGTPAAAAMILSLPQDHFRILPTVKDDIDEVPSGLAAWMDQVQCHFGVIHGDPTNRNLPVLIEDISRRTNGFLVGAVTSSTGAVHQIADQTTNGGVSGVVFAPQVSVATCLSQGCAPISGSHVISECVDNVLIGLDGERAIDVFKADIGADLATDLRQVAGLIHVALPIEGSDTGDYLVRSLVGIDPDRGWLAISEEVSSGDRVMFVRRDQQSADTDLRNNILRMKRRLGGAPRGGLYFSCLGRGPSLFEQEAHEITVITDLLGDIPLVGFYGNGEISNSRLYGFTGVLVLFL
ncbi:MAG TPA: histidine kinase [Rhodospirillales bacterium]|nr:histidine kinase [Rhodospirillales bacterium]